MFAGVMMVDDGGVGGDGPDRDRRDRIGLVLNIVD